LSWVKIIGIAAIAWIVVEAEKAIRRRLAGRNGPRERATNSMQQAM
jgi:hypothetical protein